MKRLLIAFTCAGTLALSACGGSSSTTTSPSSTISEASTQAGPAQLAGFKKSWDCPGCPGWVKSMKSFENDNVTTNLYTKEENKSDALMICNLFSRYLTEEGFDNRITVTGSDTQILALMDPYGTQCEAGPAFD